MYQCSVFARMWYAIAFAKNVNIAPGIVVGRLQKDGRLKYDWHNQLKRKFELVMS